MFCYHEKVGKNSWTNLNIRRYGAGSPLAGSRPGAHVQHLGINFAEFASSSVCRQYNPSIPCWDLHWCECLCEKKKTGGKINTAKKTCTRWGPPSAEKMVEHPQSINRSIDHGMNIFFPKPHRLFIFNRYFLQFFTFNSSPWMYSNLKTKDVLNMKNNQDTKKMCWWRQLVFDFLQSQNIHCFSHWKRWIILCFIDFCLERFFVWFFTAEYAAFDFFWTYCTPGTKTHGTSRRRHQ